MAPTATHHPALPKPKGQSVRRHWQSLEPPLARPRWLAPDDCLFVTRTVQWHYVRQATFLNLPTPAFVYYGS